MDTIVGLLAGIATGITVLFIFVRRKNCQAAWEDGVFWGYQASKEGGVDAVNYLDIAYEQKRLIGNAVIEREHRHRKHQSLVS